MEVPKMAKSPLAKGTTVKTVKHSRNKKNIVSLHFTIPYKNNIDNNTRELDISSLLHYRADKDNEKVRSRIPFLRSFCDKAYEYLSTGKSAKSISCHYENLKKYIFFCDAVSVDPFSLEGYLKYAGNDGELRHQIKMYTPSAKLWQRQDGDEIGIKESTATGMLSSLRQALTWSGLPAEIWAITHHNGFSGETTPFKGYSDEEEALLISRLKNIFYTLAPQLISIKEQGLTLPDTLPLAIDLSGHTQVLSIPTTLTPKGGTKGRKTAVNSGCAFNIVMGAAYHLLCFFTSLNDTNVRDVSYPIIVHTDERDKSLETVKVSSFKTRANKQVDAILTNEAFNHSSDFDIQKRSGVEFIKTLEKLAKLYSNNEEISRLLFTLNSDGNKNKTFNLTLLNRQLTSILNLVSPYRAVNLPWFIELFYHYRNQKIINLKLVTNELGRSVIRKKIKSCSKSRSIEGATKAAYCIMSCYTELPLKGIRLPLSYSEKDSDGNTQVSFVYRNGREGAFIVPAESEEIIHDIEQFSNQQADKQHKNHERLLLKLCVRGHQGKPRDWEGISLISSHLMQTWSIQTDDYFISLKSSRWREMTSNQVYSDLDKTSVQSILQNTAATIDKHYANGDPRLNKKIISQAMQTAELITEMSKLPQAKQTIAKRLKIPILTHDEWQERKRQNEAKTNPNGTVCNGKQDLMNGKNTQNSTNYAIGAKLPCAEYDMCYKCKSAKAVDEVQAIYKLISFIDALKEMLNQYPEANSEVFEKIEAFEFTLDGSSPDVYDNAISLFNKNGRHPRVSTDHAILSLYH